MSNVASISRVDIARGELRGDVRGVHRAGEGRGRVGRSADLHVAEVPDGVAVAVGVDSGGKHVARGCDLAGGVDVDRAGDLAGIGDKPIAVRPDGAREFAGDIDVARNGAGAQRSGDVRGLDIRGERRGTVGGCADYKAADLAERAPVGVRGDGGARGDVAGCRGRGRKAVIRLHDTGGGDLVDVDVAGDDAAAVQRAGEPAVGVSVRVEVDVGGYLARCQYRAAGGYAVVDLNWVRGEGGGLDEAGARYTVCADAAGDIARGDHGAGYIPVVSAVGVEV